MTEKPAAALPHVRLGRRVGFTVFSLVVGALTVNFSVQIIDQAFGLKAVPSALPCAEGLLGLIQGLEQARQSAAVLDGEAVALEAFRSALGPSWDQRHRVREACRDTPRWLEGFRQIERLRYAEEHAVRYESRGVAVDRRRVLALRKELEKPAAPHPRP
jgi:hypothetical protein